MVDALIKLLEKLTELLKYRRELKEQKFAKTVEPVFEALKVIHRDYLQMFTTCQRGLSEGVDLSVVARGLMSDRLEQEATRRSILSLVGVFSNSKNFSAFHSFFEAVRGYFYSAELSSESTSSSELLEEMEQWVIEEHRGSFTPTFFNANGARDLLSDIVASTLESIRERWLGVTDEYAKILSDVSGT